MKNLLLYPVAIALFVGTLMALPTLAVAQDAGVSAECDGDRDRSQSTRRRNRGSNRDCEYREVVVDENSPDGIKEISVQATYRRTVLPQRYSTIPRPTAQQFVEAVPIPDRWRIVDSLGYADNWWDPYNQNTIKADKPIHGDWFFNVTAISDSVVEFREVPTPVGGQTTRDPDSLDVLGNTQQALFNQNIPVELVYYKGDTVFRPPDWEIRFTPVFNYNYTELDEILGVNADPDEGNTRNDDGIGIQAAFVDKHLRNVSDRYDFDSARVGIQPFSSDFRGFLFQDSPFGARLFGTRDNNRFQYNLAWFRIMEKYTNSGLNNVTEDMRDNDVFLANLYWQDQPQVGFISQVSLIYNYNDETNIFYDDNDFIARPASIGLERPRKYDVTYLGYNGDGHFGRVNLTVSTYAALGQEKEAVFSGENSDVEAFFVAAEPSMDFDWIRGKLSFLYGSGDNDPFDDKSEGFDSIVENPQFAGGETSYWIRQAVPLIGGGRVALTSRNSVLNAMRSSKENGQSNFTNPGIWLAGAGADMDLLPELRLSLNANYLAFAETEVLEIARAQANVDQEIGMDLSAAVIWRPYMTQNVVVRLSYAQLVSGKGYQDLYGDEDPYSLLFNVIVTF